MRPGTGTFRDLDETREFPNGRAEILRIGGGEVGRLVLEPRVALVGPGDITALPGGHDAWVVGDHSRGDRRLVRRWRLRQVSQATASTQLA
jgi:hypothetical protein